MQLDDIERKYNLITVRDAISTATLDKDSKTFILDGKKFLDKKTALRELYEVLGFKDYISHMNYDGFEELMSPDLWRDSHRLVLRIVDAHRLESMNTQDLAILLSILQASAERWKSAKKVLDIELIG